MGGFITQESIDEVSLKTDIVQVIGEYVQLTERGTDWWGCCPFHNEKTPSFSVSPTKKFYYCFGCHAKGTIFNFISEMEKVSFPEAVELLARKAGVQLQYANSGSDMLKEDPISKKKSAYIDLYTRVATSFHYMLMQTEAGAFALDYITKRGITTETLEKFKLGYAPQDRFWLKRFLRKKNFSDDFLNESGLFTKKNPEAAFFFDRLMFPICNRKGEVVAMGGRFLRGDPQKSPKYLNSGDLVQYKKGNTLYAFHLAKAAIREKKCAIFCEGYMDCIAYHQCGISYAVAPLGTALTDEQIVLVKPFVETILLSFDSDGAGQNATRRAILLCRKHDITVKVIQLTGGKDPAEILLNFGAEVLTKQVNNAILDNDFLLSKLLEVYPKESPEGKAKASYDFFAYMDALQSDVQKEACLEQLCQAYDIAPEAARKDYNNREQLSQRIKRSGATQTQAIAAENDAIKLSVQLRAVLTAVNDDVSLFQKMCNEIRIEDLDDPHAKKLFRIMQECKESGSFSVSNILNRCESDELRGLIIQSVTEYSSCVEQSVNDSILLIKRTVLSKKRASVLQRIRSLEQSALSEDHASIATLLAQKMEIDKQIALLKG